MVSFYSLSFSVLVRAFCCDDDDENDDDDVEAERERESSREKILLFFCFLNFFSNPKKSLRQKTNKLFFDQKRRESFVWYHREKWCV